MEGVKGKGMDKDRWAEEKGMMGRRWDRREREKGKERGWKG